MCCKSSVSISILSNGLDQHQYNHHYSYHHESYHQRIINNVSPRCSVTAIFIMALFLILFFNDLNQVRNKFIRLVVE